MEVVFGVCRREGNTWLGEGGRRGGENRELLSVGVELPSFDVGVKAVRRKLDRLVIM